MRPKGAAGVAPGGSAGVTVPRQPLQRQHSSGGIWSPALPAQLSREGLQDGAARPKHPGLPSPPR